MIENTYSNINFYPVSTGGYKNATELKLQHPKLKVLIGIGGRNDGGLKFSIMTKNPLLRTQFVTSVLEFVKKHE